MNELSSIRRQARHEQTVHLRMADGSALRLTRHGAEGCDKSHLRRALAAAARAIQQAPAVTEPPCWRHGMICGDPRMREVIDMLERVAPTDASILITGENGTGKELVARAAHDLSPRARRPFVAVNCSALNDGLLESELFGHRRGAFTGATDERVGMFEAADAGTLFLDEVGDMSPALQVRVLRVLQEGQITPVGDTRTRQVDVRVVAATNCDLEQAVAAGRFREDLYYRLHVVALRLPPLRERADLDALVDHFTAQLNRKLGTQKALSETTHALLRRHSWPGNVRELANELERSWVLSGDDDYVGPTYLRAVLHERGGDRPAPTAALAQSAQQAASLPETLAEVERQLIAQALERARGNRTHTARALGISRRNLLRKIAALGL